MAAIRRTGVQLPAQGRADDRIPARQIGGKDYTLSVSTRPEYFRLPAYAAEPLLEAAGRDALLGMPAPPPEAAGAAGAAGG